MRHTQNQQTAGSAGTAIMVLLAVVLAGTMIGSVLCVQYAQWKLWRMPVFLQGMALEGETAFGDSLQCRLLIPLGWLALYGAAGFSVLGMPAALLMLLLRGAALGCVLGQTYLAQGVTGLLTALGFVMPYAFCSTLLYVLAAREVLRFSAGIGKTIFRRSGEPSAPLRMYALRYMVLAVFLSLLGILQCCWLQYGYQELVLGE